MPIHDFSNNDNNNNKAMKTTSPLIKIFIANLAVAALVATCFCNKGGPTNDVGEGASLGSIDSSGLKDPRRQLQPSIINGIDLNALYNGGVDTNQFQSGLFPKGPGAFVQPPAPRPFPSTPGAPTTAPVAAPAPGPPTNTFAFIDDPRLPVPARVDNLINRVNFTTSSILSSGGFGNADSIINFVNASSFNIVAGQGFAQFPGN